VKADFSCLKILYYICQLHENIHFYILLSKYYRNQQISDKTIGTEIMKLLTIMQFQMLVR